MSGVFVRDHARAAAIQHRVAVIAPQPVASGRPAVLARADSALPTTWVRYRQSRLPLAAAVAYTGGVFAALRALDRSGFRPDLIHAHVYEVGPAALLAGRRYRVPVILSEHSSHFSLGDLSQTARRRARLVASGVDLLCPVSEDLRARMEAMGLRARFEVVPNPVDSDIFTPGPPPAAAPATALFVGSLDPVKGLDLLLRALARLEHVDLRLDVVGDGPARAVVEGLIESLGLRERVRLWGYLGRPQVADRMRAAHFLVVPSVVETFGIVMAEALSVGRPVVAVRAGAIPEIVDEQAGLLVGRRDEHALAEAVSEMAATHRDYDWRTLSSRARRRFGLAVVGERWDAIYRSLVPDVRAPVRTLPGAG